MNSKRILSAVMATAFAVTSAFGPVWGPKVTKPNCEDIDVTPCVMWDEGRWILVRDFESYKVETVKFVSKKGKYVTVRLRVVRRLPAGVFHKA